MQDDGDEYVEEDCDQVLRAVVVVHGLAVCGGKKSPVSIPGVRKNSGTQHCKVQRRRVCSQTPANCSASRHGIKCLPQNPVQPLDSALEVTVGKATENQVHHHGVIAIHLLSRGERLRWLSYLPLFAPSLLWDCS